MNKPLTLINPQNGHLAFKVFSIDDHSHFDHVQRLNYYTLILVEEGEGDFHVDFSNFQYEAPCMIAFAPYQPFLFNTSFPLKGQVIHFHPDFFCIHKHHSEVACNGVLFNDIYNPPRLSLRKTEMEIFLTIVLDIRKEMVNPELAQYELLISYLKILLIQASRLKISQNPEIEESIPTREEPFILQNLKDAIEIHYKEKHTVNEYADLLKIPSKTLAKISKNHFNRTISNLITERIIIEAKRELYLTSKPVKNIAYDLGFSDEHYFSRYFKNNTEISPQLYRETVGFARGEA